MIFHTMNSIAVFVLVSLTLVAATVVFAVPNAVQARISYCASGTDIFQCFIKKMIVRLSQRLMPRQHALEVKLRKIPSTEH